MTTPTLSKYTRSTIDRECLLPLRWHLKNVSKIAGQEAYTFVMSITDEEADPVKYNPRAMPPNRDDPDEKYKYRLYDEIASFNLLLRTKIGLRLSVFLVLEGYEHPFFDSLNHQKITSSLPGDKKTGRPISGNCFSMLMLFLFRLPLKSHLDRPITSFNKPATRDKGN